MQLREHGKGLAKRSSVTTGVTIGIRDKPTLYKREIQARIEV